MRRETAIRDLAQMFVSHQKRSSPKDWFAAKDDLSGGRAGGDPKPAGGKPIYDRCERGRCPH